MGHTNSTANLALPQFIGTDKPTWLGDINGAFSAIDAYAGTNDAAVAAAASDASSAISQASAAVNTANTANTTAGNASTTANNAIGVANTANAIAGTVDAKVGLLADLNTADRTNIVNAINEVFAEATGTGTPVTATGDGVKTFSQVLDTLHSLIDPAKINHKSILVYTYTGNEQIYHLCNMNTEYDFTRSVCGATAFAVNTINCKSSSSTFYTGTAEVGSTSFENTSNYVMGSGDTFKIFY